MDLALAEQALGADALAKMRAVGVVGNFGMHAQRQKPTKRHVGDRAFHALTIGQAIVKAQEQDLEHADRIDVRQLLEIAIRSFDFDVRSAANGNEALEIYRRDGADLVLMDVQMPVVDGPTTRHDEVVGAELMLNVLLGLFAPEGV